LLNFVTKQETADQPKYLKIERSELDEFDGEIATEEKKMHKKDMLELK